MAARLKLEFDVVEMAKEASRSRSQREVYLRVVARDVVKREFAKRVIDRIEQRLDEGIDKNGRPMTGYSKAYAESRVGRIYGKRQGARANLKLTGAMRSDISVTKITTRTVEIGFRSGLENDKAHGHVNGSGGLPVRDFWGIPRSEQITILKETMRDYESVEDISFSGLEDAFEPIGIGQVGEQDPIDLTLEDFSAFEFSDEF